jgi:hypothetical protein
MIETIILSIIFAKIKRYKLKPLFKSWTIYPILAFALIYIILEIMIFIGNYDLVKYTNIFKITYLCTFLILIIKYKLYPSAIIGSIFVLIGGVLNNIAIAANNGKMPVFPALSYLTGYVKQASFTNAADIHILGNSSVKLKYLTDIIDVGYSILSIGDVFIRLFAFIIIYSAIKNSNLLDIR